MQTSSLFAGWLRHCLLAMLMLVTLLPIHAFAEGLADYSYRLGAGDEIQIRVFGEDDMEVKSRISETGTINYPFLGEIRVSGQTVSELEKTIIKGLKGPYLVDPVVSVNILTYRPFFVNGEVQKPGAIPYQPGITIRKAIAISGGFTERAQRKYVDVLSGADKNGTPKETQLDEVVSPGDIITVKESFF